jgi:hypothetical protein
MSGQQVTYESVLELIQKSSQEFINSLKEQGAEFDRRMQERDARYEREKQEREERDARYAREKQERDAEFAKLRQETERQFKRTAAQLERTQKEIGNLGNNVGAMVENMIGEKIVEKFQALGINVTSPVRRNHSFLNTKIGVAGEFDLMLVDTDIIIIIEVKLNVEISDVRHFLEQIEEYRRHINAVGFVKPPFTHLLPSTRFVGAVAGGVVDEKAMKFAHENGLFVIVQAGDAVEIAPRPEGFQPKKW